MTDNERRLKLNKAKEDLKIAERSILEKETHRASYLVAIQVLDKQITDIALNIYDLKRDIEWLEGK